VTAGPVERAVALLLAGSAATAGCPPGIDPTAFAHALAEDVADLLSDLPGLSMVVAHTPEHAALAAAVRWPGTTLLPLRPGEGPVAVLAALARSGYGAGAVVAPDVPDLPALLVAKVFAGLAEAEATVLPALPAGRTDLAVLGRVPAARTGGLVALGCRLPVPGWLTAGLADLDRDDAVGALRAAAPRRGLVVTPAWRRLRVPADIAGLDPGLEGWEATRTVLSGRSVR
jgi:hypothetical protein